MIADGAVHAIGACLGLIGDATIVVITVRMERIEVTSIGLVTMLALPDPTAIILFSRKPQTANNAGGAKTCCRTVPSHNSGKGSKIMCVPIGCAADRSRALDPTCPGEK